MKLACQEQLLPGESILEKWEFAASAGFDGIELQGTDGWRGRLDDLRAARNRGVVFSSVCDLRPVYRGFRRGTAAVRL